MSKAEPYPPTGPYPPATYNSQQPPSASGGVSAPGVGGSAGVGGGLLGGGGLIGGTGIGGFGAPFFGGPFIPPFGGIPPIGPPPPPFALSPICATLEAIKLKVQKLAEPLLIGGIGAIIFWILKAVLIPQIGLFATIFKKRMDGEENVIDRITNDVTRALNEGICINRMACSLGVSAQNIPGAKAMLRLIGNPNNNDENSLLNVFKTAALNKNTDCNIYSCFGQDSTNLITTN